MLRSSLSKRLFSTATESMNSLVKTESSNGCRSLILNNPKALGSINETMVNRMNNLLLVWEASDLCKLVVLRSTSSPKAFCAGGDVKGISVVDTSNPFKGPR